MSTRKVLLILVLVVSLALVFAGCSKVATAGGGPQAGTVSLQSAGEVMPRTISVNGIGMASAQPDVAFVQLGVESIDTQAGQAVEDNTTRMSAVMDVLKEMNVQDEDIQTVNYSMWIEQVVDRDGQPTGENRYHVVNQVRIRLRDLTQTGELLQQALAAGANNVGGISFSVADPAALQREARDKAIANARAKAEQLASGLDAQLGSLRQASEYGGLVTPFAEAPMMAMGIGGGGGPVPVSNGEFNVTVEVQVIFEIAE
jgi:uncharacterized protein YggE